MDRLCRICLASESSEVFKDFFTPNKDYAQKLFFLTNITVFEVSNKLPALICNRCTDNLTRAYKLKKLALETDNFFKQITDTDDIKILTDILNGEEHKIKTENQVSMIEHDPEYSLEEMIDFTMPDVKVEALEEENGSLIEALDDCEEIFMQEPDGNENLNEIKEEKKVYKCNHENCSKSFHKAYLLRNHLESHQKGTIRVKKEKDKIYKCDFQGCSKAFHKPYLLKNHKENHEPEDKIYNCEYEGCNLTFNRTYLLRKHMRTHGFGLKLKLSYPRHGDKKIYSCEYEGCGKTYLRPYQLKEHLEFHSGERNYKCELCGNTFFALSNLKGHIRDIHTFIPHYCDLCGKICRNKSYLCMHIHAVHLKHNKNRSTICHLCGKTLSSKGMLKIHMLYSHGGEKSFKCQVCDKAFFTSHRLKQHVDANHGERPWVCELCARTFSHRYKLGEHMKQVHKTVLNAVKRHDCTLCGASYDRIKNLHNHLSEKHQVIIEEDE